MIQLPRRSVTRYFIPLIDVMTLLFCMFLLMPIFRAVDPETLRASSKTPPQDLQRLKSDRDQLKAALEELLKKQVQPQALSIRVFEVDPKDGRLFYHEGTRPPRPKYVETEAEARDVVERHLTQLKQEHDNPATRPKPHYLILMPRVDSAFPQEQQLAAYRKWFEGTSFSIDRPGNPP